MIIDVSVGLKDIHGRNMIETIEGQGIPVTLKSVLVGCLLSPAIDDSKLTGKEKLMRYNLANKIHAADGIIDLTVEEIVLVKDLTAKIYSTWVTGQTLSLLPA